MSQNSFIISASASQIASTECLKPSSFTQYPAGSFRELWAISFPLMLSLLSGSVMLFFDRLFLAQYSVYALTASATATLIASAVQFAFISTTTIAEVFVGQHNGAGRFRKVGEPVWQMIWFSLMSIGFFWPLGFLGAPLIFQNPGADLEMECFRWLMFCGPIFCLVASLTAFYIGLGKVRFVTISIIVANVVNVLLDIILIFGWPPYFPALGITGAVMATGISQLLQLVILFADFIRKENQIAYGTGNFSLNLQSLLQCLKVAIPNSIAHTLEISAWAVLFQMMNSVSHEHVTVVAISQSIFLLFAFITDGVSKGASAIAANLIGAKEWSLVWKLFRSGVRFYFIIFLLLGIILAFDPAPVIHWFLPDAEETLKSSITSACLWVWLFFLFDGINWLIVGLLTAAGDTQFVLKIGGTTPWLFAILPIYILVVLNGFGAHVAWQMVALYSFLTCGIYFWRFKKGKWKEISL